MKTYTVLSIDAWRDGLGGWEWNNWFNVGTVELDIDGTPRHVFKMMREQGFLSVYSRGRVRMEDDDYNLVIIDRNNDEPVFAIQYGDTLD